MFFKSLSGNKQFYFMDKKKKNRITSVVIGFDESLKNFSNLQKGFFSCKSFQGIEQKLIV